MGNGRSDSSPGATGELEAVFEAAAPGEPLTSSEVAAELGCARTTAYKKLRRLADAGTIRTKKVGARGRVWWLPVEVEGAIADPRSDVSDRDDGYEELLRRERQYRAVFEQAFDAILIADDDAEYVDANPAACDLFGLPREDLLGRSIAAFAAEGYDVEGAWRDFREADLDRGLFPLRRADGEQRIVEFAATPNVLPGRHLSVLRDVTERREARDELERARERTRQYQRMLAADTVVDLEIEIDGCVFSRLSSRLGCQCELEGVVSASTDRLLQYVTVSGVPAGAVLAFVEGALPVNECRVVYESEGRTLVELELERSPTQTLVEVGAVCRSLKSERGVTTVVAEVGADSDLQGLINEFRAVYPDARIVAKRTLDRPVVTTMQYHDSVASRLTERQTETLRAAHHAGYFEWPRTSTAERIASSMGLATSTWLRHLRLGEAKIVRWCFEELDI